MAIIFALFFFGFLITFSIVMLIFIIFGKLIILQIRRWLLASKGYVEVEHISPTKVRNYFIMKPSDHKFDINDGFYHYIPECITRKGDIIKKFDKAFLSKAPEVSEEELDGLSDKDRLEFIRRNEVEWKELQGLYKIVTNMKYDPQLLNRKFGMPVITYYGDNPDPINPSDRSKSYGSGVIKDMYLRLLLTQRYKDFKMIILVMLICLGVIAIANFGFWQVLQKQTETASNCMFQLNVSNSRYMELVNQTLTAKFQPSTMVVG